MFRHVLILVLMDDALVHKEFLGIMPLGIKS